MECMHLQLSYLQKSGCCALTLFTVHGLIFQLGFLESYTGCWHFPALSVSHDKIYVSTKCLASQIRAYVLMSGLRGSVREGAVLF